MPPSVALGDAGNTQKIQSCSNLNIYRDHVPPSVALGELALEWLPLLSRMLKVEAFDDCRDRVAFKGIKSLAELFRLW